MAIHVKSWPGFDTGGAYRNKYGAVRVRYCIPCEDVSEEKTCKKCKQAVMIFDSHAEYRRFRELRLLEKFEKISALETQPKYPLMVNGELICTYFADFRYRDEKGEQVVEDVKGVRTAIYKFKKKLLKALYGIEVLET